MYFCVRIQSTTICEHITYCILAEIADEARPNRSDLRYELNPFDAEIFRICIVRVQGRVRWTFGVDDQREIMEL